MEPENRADMIGDFYRKKDFTGWFDVLYGQANGNSEIIPWANLEPNEFLVDWVEQKQLVGKGKTAIVVGCGLGDDAEFLSSLGFAVTAFDISENAITWCQKRFPESSVVYQVADLFNLPQDWQNAFDFVFESFTIQALPLLIREQTIINIAKLVAVDGQLLVVAFGREHDEPTPHVPFPLSKQELDIFQKNGLTEIQFDEFSQTKVRLMQGGIETTIRMFRFEYQRNS